MSQPQRGGSPAPAPPTLPGQWNPQTQWAPTQQWNAPPPAYGPAYAPAPGPAPAPRKNPLRLVLLVVIGLGLLALAGLVLLNVTAQPAEVAYANDDYQVPAADLNVTPLPVPQSEAQAMEWLTTNALYNQTAPAPVRCEIQPIDVATADNDLLKSHFEETMACLVRVWQPPLTAAGFEIFRPTVTIYEVEITTKCGSGKEPYNAFYCDADQQIYWSRTLGEILTPSSVSRWAGDEVLAHEFGHVIQGRTGILMSRNLLRRQAPTEAEKLRLTRRNETQADCLAGIFIRSVSRSLGLQQSDVPVIQDNFASAGDDVTGRKKPEEGNHGQSSTRRYWGTVGLGTAEAGKCNTYSAPANQVR